MRRNRNTRTWVGTASSNCTAAMIPVMRAAHPLVTAIPVCTKRLELVTVVVLSTVCALSAQTKTSTAPKASSRLASAINRTLEQGRDATLPPHISHLLGISPQEHEVPVKQFTQMGEPIRGFEVSRDEHNNVVVFVERRAQKKATFYLTSPRGRLRRVLSVIEGVGYDRLPTESDKKEFEIEKQYWIDLLTSKKP